MPGRGKKQTPPPIGMAVGRLFGLVWFGWLLSLVGLAIFGLIWSDVLVFWIREVSKKSNFVGVLAR